MIDAARASVGLMLALVVFFQIVFGLFFLRLWRRLRRLAPENQPSISSVDHDGGS